MEKMGELRKSTWEELGKVATIAQLTGIDAIKLIGMIVEAAKTARMYKKNCTQFAENLRLIGNLLNRLRISELKMYPETREPLEQLENTLRTSYILVTSCQNRSYLYLFIKSRKIVHHFNTAQSEIDRYLKLISLVTLVDNARIKEMLEYIANNQYHYTISDDEDIMQVQNSDDGSSGDALVFDDYGRLIDSIPCAPYAPCVASSADNIFTAAAASINNQGEMENNRKSSTGVGVASNGYGKKLMRKVACPLCTVHLQVDVFATSSETIECCVCRHHFISERVSSIE